jgi:hypothetical protein
VLATDIDGASWQNHGSTTRELEAVLAGARSAGIG